MTLNEPVQDVREQIDKLLAQARERRNDDPVLVRTLLNQARTLLAEVDYPEAYIVFLLADGVTAFYEGDFSRTLTALNEYLAQPETLQTDKGHRNALNMLAATNRQLGDLDRAIELYDRLREYCEAQQDTGGMLQALNGLAAVYSYMEDNTAALNYIEQALDLARQHQKVLEEGMLLGNSVRIFTLLNQPQRAIENGQLAIKRLTEVDKQALSVHARMYTATAYCKLGQYEQAAVHLKQAIELAETYNMQDNRLQAMCYLAEVHRDHGDPAAALTLLHAILDQANETHPLSRLDSYRLLYEIHKAQGEYQQALHYLEQHRDLREKVHSQEAEERLRNLEIRHRTREALQEADFYRRRSAEIEALREQDRRYFERLTQIKDDFISITSHDLKNPLTRIMLNLDMLERHQRLDDERGQKLLDRMRSAILMMKDMLTDILDLVRLETGRGLQWEAVSIAAMVAEVHAAFEVSTEEKHLNFTTDVPDDLRAVCDAKMIRSALHNLLSNAIKYTPENGCVCIRAAPRSTGDVAIHVSDSGLGIGEDDLLHIFDRFYRAAQQPPNTEGTGLGLAIVKLIVESHGGRIDVESQPGEGSTFTITLPKHGLPDEHHQWP